MIIVKHIKDTENVSVNEINGDVFPKEFKYPLFNIIFCENETEFFLYLYFLYFLLLLIESLRNLFTEITR